MHIAHLFFLHNNNDLLWLYQSFNLKPAAQTRPSIQGPATNLKLAAILEKANAMRQIVAGSDDDSDNDDSWSDS